MKSVIVAVVPAELPWRRALAWLAFLGPFFFASYGLATWLSAHRAHVRSVVFDWEHGIPFAPWTIVPYWSIDVLYGLSLFLCSNRSELDTHAKRLLTAQLISIAFFVTMPLKFSFERPVVEGSFGWLFRTLASFDQPFNQAPSLHVALLVILWALYARKLGPVARMALHAWFALIGVSVLTTWQHHFIDLPTGALLGFFCMWLWPMRQAAPRSGTQWTNSATRWRLAAYYALGAMFAVGIAAIVGGAALWLLWVALALWLVGFNYARLGAAGFQKSDGALSPAATALLAPYLAGAAFNAWAWTRARPMPDHVADRVWIGRLPLFAASTRNRFAAMVDMSCELPAVATPRVYSNVQVLDLTVPDTPSLVAAVNAIERGRVVGDVLVCCALGYSRSASAVATWLVASGRASSVDEAVRRLRDARPGIVLGHGHRTAIANACSQQVMHS